MYAEIINNNVSNIYKSLPQTFRNISNFHALSNNKLTDLSWAGHSDVKFYACEPFTVPQDDYNYEPSYVINENNKTVSVTLTQTSLKVPDSVTATQIRLWLVSNNISLSSVETAINNISDTLLREQTRVQWEYAPYIERYHPLLESLGSALGLNSDQIDIAFVQASKL
jgi:Leucine-rich repeat (LRR) protein